MKIADSLRFLLSLYMKNYAMCNTAHVSLPYFERCSIFQINPNELSDKNRIRKYHYNIVQHVQTLYERHTSLNISCNEDNRLKIITLKIINRMIPLEELTIKCPQRRAH